MRARPMFDGTQLLELDDYLEIEAEAESLFRDSLTSTAPEADADAFSPLMDRYRELMALSYTAGTHRPPFLEASTETVTSYSQLTSECADLQLQIHEDLLLLCRKYFNPDLVFIGRLLDCLRDGGRAAYQRGLLEAVPYLEGGLEDALVIPVRAQARLPRPHPPRSRQSKSGVDVFGRRQRPQ